MKIKKVTEISYGEVELLKKLIESVGWNEQQITGQIQSIKSFTDNKNAIVYIVEEEEQIIAYATGEFYSWNRLGQIHGLVVHPEYRRKKIASELIGKVEEFFKGKASRGAYVDTPVDNQIGREFYENIGYSEAYIMPEYYDKGKDGVTYIKLFN